MTHVRSNAGGQDGYSIQRVEEKDENENIISSWYEVFDPDGNFVSECESIEDAHDVIRRHQSNIGMQMGM